MQNKEKEPPLYKSHSVWVILLFVWVACVVGTVLSWAFWNWALPS